MPRSRRFTRNPEFRLYPEVPSGAPESWSLSGLTVMGIVCNPKTHEPALAVTDGEYVSLRGLSDIDPLKRLGRGYYEESSNEPSRMTLLPRCHLPDGVVVKGKGWGTTLYTALCLGAHLKNDDVVEIKMWLPRSRVNDSERGDGVCSWTENRSGEADKWWDAAVRLGLCEQETETHEESETEEHVELNLSPGDLDEFVEDGEVVYVNEVDVDIEKKTETEVTVEKYPYEKASDDHHLVACAMNVEIPRGLSADQSLAFLWRAVQDDSDLVPEADPHALLALDVRGLNPAALRLIVLCFTEANLKDAAIDELLLRYERGLDPGSSSGQGRLFVNGAGLEDVLTARESAGWAELARLP